MTPLRFTHSLFTLALITLPMVALQPSASAQHFTASQMRFEHLSDNQGLGSNAVKQLLQDSKGFLWIVTETSIDRYDGIRFKHYQLDALNPQPNVPAFCIFEDRQGVIWAGGSTGQLNRLDPNTDSFRKLANLPSVIANSNIDNFAAGERGLLWMGTNHGLVRYDPVTNRADSFVPTPQAEILSLTLDSHGQVWVGTPNGLRVLDQSSGVFSRVTMSPDENQRQRLRVTSLLAHPSGILFVGTENGLFTVDTAQRSWKAISTIVPLRLPQGTQGISSIIALDDHTLVLGIEDGGLALLDLNGSQVEWIKHNPKKNDSIAGDSVKTLLLDRSGVLWVGDFIAGLSKYSSEQNAFRLYRNDPFDDRTLSGNYIRGISEAHDGKLWVCTQFNGLNLVDPKTGETKRYQRATGKLPHDGTYAVLEDKAGDVWVGLTTNNGLARLDRKADRFVRFPYLQELAVTAFYEDSERTLWVGSTGGVYEISSDRKTVRHHPEFLGMRDPTRDDIEAIFVDRQRNIWIGQNGSLITVVRSSGAVRDRTRELGSIPPNTYVCGFFESGDVIWIATKGAGAFRYDRNTDQISPLFPPGGSPNNNVYSILEDHNGKLWLSADDGIVRYDPATGKMVQFGPQDGLQGKEFNRRASCCTRNGDFYFGGTNGLNGFTPELVKIRNTAAPVVISGLSVNGVPVAATSQVDLDYTKNTIAVELAVLDFSAPQLNRYEVKLEGIDKDWVVLGNESKVVYGNLRPNNYVLRVRGANSTGAWNEALPMSIRITPPWWRKGWAIGLYILLTLGAIGGLGATARYRSRTRSRLRDVAARAQAALAEKKAEQERAEAAELQSRELARAEAIIRAKNEQLASLVNELTASEQTAHEATRAKSEFVASISHEIRTPLNAVLSMAHMLLRSSLSETQKEYAMTIRAAGGALMALLDDVLDLSKIEAGALKLDLQPFDIRALLNESVSLITYSATEKKIDVRLNVDDAVPQAILSDQNRLRQVLLNLLGNAIKFTDQGSVSVEVSASLLDGDATDGSYRIEFSIKDTGIGIPADKLSGLFKMFSRAESLASRRVGGTGLGLAISRRITKAMGGDIEVESEIGVGSTFRAWIVARAGEAAVQPIPLELVAGQTVDGETAIRVLVADDSDINRYVMQEMLASLGMKADFVSSGPEVLEAMQLKPYNVILMDVHMPNMDGIEVTRRIRDTPTDQPVRIIALTADVLSTTHNRCLEVGMDAVLTKPVDVEQLRLAIVQGVVEPEVGQVGPGSARAILDRERFERLQSLSRKSGSQSLKALVEPFITQCDDTLARLAKSCDEGALKQVAQLAHKLSGTVATLGAERMTAACLEVQACAMSNSHNAIEASISALRLEYTQLCDELLSLQERYTIDAESQASTKI